MTPPTTQTSPTSPLPAPPERAGARQWLGLALLVVPTLLLAADITVLYLALPHLGADLGPTSTETLWIVDAYGFLLAGFLITTGTLGDRVGSRRVLLAGAVGFGLAALIAANAADPGTLIAARAIMGLAGAALLPSTMALIAGMFHDPAQRTPSWGGRGHRDPRKPRQRRLPQRDGRHGARRHSAGRRGRSPRRPGRRHDGGGGPAGRRRHESAGCG